MSLKKGSGSVLISLSGDNSLFSTNKGGQVVLLKLYERKTRKVISKKVGVVTLGLKYEKKKLRQALQTLRPFSFLYLK